MTAPVWSALTVQDDLATGVRQVSIDNPPLSVLNQAVRR